MRNKINNCCPAMINKKERFLYYPKGNFAYNIKKGQFGFQYSFNDVMVVKYCPFCGEELKLEEKDPVELLMAIYRGLRAGSVGKDFTVGMFFDELGYPEEDRSDFIFTIINIEALKRLKQEDA